MDKTRAAAACTVSAFPLLTPLLLLPHAALHLVAEHSRKLLQHRLVGLAAARTAGESKVAAHVEPVLLLMGGRAGTLFCPRGSAMALQLRAGGCVAAPKLRACRAGGEAAMLGDKVYLVGGFDFDVLSTMEALTFTPHYSALAAGTVDAASAAGAPGELSMLRLKPAASWDPMPRLKKARTRFGMCALHGLLWVFGGADADGTVLSSVEVFDPETNVWMQTADPMPTARQGLGVAVLGGKIYVIGGSDGEGLSLDVVEVYDPTSGTWDEAQKMHHRRERFGICVLDACIFVAGGFSEEGRPVFGARMRA